jgi:hypothetical protein
LLAIADSLRMQNDSLSAEAQRRVDKAGSGVELASVFGTIQPVLQHGRNNYLAAIARARTVLTPAQWMMLPETVRSPTMFGPTAPPRPPTSS